MIVAAQGKRKTKSNEEFKRKEKNSDQCSNPTYNSPRIDVLLEHFEKLSNRSCKATCR